MADFVRITKNGIVAYEWDGERRDYFPKLNGFTHLSDLRSRCELEEGITLGDIFNAVQRDEVLKETVAHYSWCRDIDAFHAQAQLPQLPDDDEEPLVGIVIEAFAEIHHNYEDKNGPDTFEGVYAHFSGLGSKGTHFSISCTPMNKLAHLPVTLVETVTFSKDFKTMFTCKHTYSLLEVLDAIYWDISFHGGPEENAAFIKHLDEMMDDIKSGKAKLVQLDLDALAEDGEVVTLDLDDVDNETGIDGELTHGV